MILYLGSNVEIEEEIFRRIVAQLLVLWKIAQPINNFL